LRIKCWDSAFRTEILIKFPYFMDTTKRGVKGWKEDQRQGEDRMNLQISLLYRFDSLWVCVCVWKESWLHCYVHINVVQFFPFWEILQYNFDIKKFMWRFSGRSLSRVLPKFEDFDIDFISFFFKFKNLIIQFLNQVRFHVHITHSLMLKIMWIQSFTTN
jgi:hypothetical protein